MRLYTSGLICDFGWVSVSNRINFYWDVCVRA